ncbi:MAG TPA: DAK2 domain-containing protein [Acidimicrobiales bacterium]|nr:DAK2 domain-containing protein [Acidimicrobiales bacterium]
METLRRLSSTDVAAVIKGYRDVLVVHRERINRLNVYPVPDGDTGTNMSLTLESVVSEIDQVDNPDMATVCKAISHGSLMGARGNSGVILSQVLRGLADTLGAEETADGATLAAGLRRASDAAYKAVMRPVEGTILTVARAMADGAEKAANGGSADLVAVLEQAGEAGQQALDQTPELLPVLAQAGVVDAGGSGLILLVDAMLNVVDGRPLPESSTPVGPAPAARASEAGADAECDVSGLRYEVMYLLEAPDDSVPGFRDAWAGVGDSIVVVGGDGLWNCHIHTDDIGAAVEAALDVGRPRNIRVTDLLEQVEEERWVREADVVEQPPPPHSETGVVAVAVGGGVRRIFRSLGVGEVITGGQTMNPSTAQLLEAVEALSCEGVVLLPNNKNIIPVAEQVVPLASKTVRVVPTKGIAEAFAALLAYDPEADVDTNARSMTEAADRVVSGEVTRAVRDSNSEAGAITEGDWLGLSRKGIEVVAPTAADAAIGLLDRLVGDEHEIVTIIEGEGARAADTRRLTEWLAENRPDAAAEVHHGGQPLYPYLLSVE